jgi:hypothetical protein
MNTKLTLRMDEHLIDTAKRYSSKAGKSVSRLVEDYFAFIAAEEGATAAVVPTELTPRVRSLLGVLRGAQVTEQDHKEHLEKKHR